jgi:glycine cleavage system H protein
VNIDAGVGDKIDAGRAFGTVESGKTLADLFAPIAGTIARVNGALEDEPELVNDDCYGRAWMVAIKPASGDALADLLDHDAYAKLLADADH